MILILITLLIKHQSIGKSIALRSLRNFILCFFCVILRYCSNAYEGIYHGIFEQDVLGRIIDFSLYILLDYFWFTCIRVHLSQMGAERPHFDKLVNWALVLFLVLSNIGCIFFISSNYFVANEIERCFVITVEYLCCIFGVLFNLIYVIFLLRTGANRESKCFIVLVSVLYSICGLISGWSVIRLAAGKILYIAGSLSFYVESSSMLLMAVCLFVYLSRHNFSSACFMESGSGRFSEEEILELIADECVLGNRDLQICRMIFRGDSHETIAEQLCISKRTGKKLVQGCCEKLGIADQTELVDLVRDRRMQENRKPCGNTGEQIQM